MLLITTIAGVRARRRQLWQQGRTVALVPTMGALHEGHLRLVDRASELADEVWASVFVNPAQFGPGEDYERYPRDLERDRTLLAGRGVALLFAPGVKEMYPRPSATVVDLPELASGLCGAFRPGHFSGVVLVVTKLLSIAQPEWAVFGAKDWQQSAVIRRLVEDLNLQVRIEVVPTVREPDGLAMSSRNAYLSPDERRAATALIRALRAAEAAIAGGERDGEAVRRQLANVVATEPLARLQYAEVVDPDSLTPLERIGRRALLALAAHVGATRLIDNLLVEVS